MFLVDFSTFTALKNLQRKTFARTQRFEFKHRTSPNADYTLACHSLAKWLFVDVNQLFLMRFLYTLSTVFFLQFSTTLFSQVCPPPGFPEPGDGCGSPILCPDLDGYCATIDNNNVARSFPCCQGWQLNNDEWFGFFAGTTTISIQITPSNCSPGGLQGLQGAIYDNCPPNNPSGAWCDDNQLAAQCECTEDPFLLSSSDFVVGEVYWIVLDGCSGNVCDYSVDVVEGSTVGFAPADPGAITGPSPICQGTSGSYEIPPVNGATQYTWTLTPASAGTMSGGTDEDVNVAWASGYSGTAELCVSTSNLCFSNPTQSCFPVEVLAKPKATISGSGVFCAGAGGSADLTVTLTGDPDWEFVYAINGVQQPPVTTSSSPYIITATQAGTYTLVSVKSIDSDPDCAGTVMGAVTLTEVTLNPSATTVAAICGQDNGSVNFSITGGNAPYTYIWSSGQTTQDLSNVPPGIYDITVTDDNGCSTTFKATVDDVISNPTLTAAVTNNTTCINGNGAIDLSVSPTGTYNYTWSSGQTIQDLNNLTPGDYTVTVTQGLTCSATGTYTVADVPNLPTVTLTPVNSSCDFANGNLNATVTGGVAPYTYLWSGGQTTQNLSNVLAGNYSLTVTGANGCTASASADVNNVNPAINISAVPVANTTCNGGNGSINLTATPGPYTYVWSNGQTNQDLTGLTPGDYTVTVSGGGTCTAEATFNVPDNPNLPMPTATATQTSCDFSNASINGSVSGGVAPYTYVWSNGATTEDLSNIPTGTYGLTVTGANGCTNILSIDVTNNNPPITVTATALPNTVCNATPNGSINVSVAPNGTYTYTWATGETTQDLSGLAPGSYTVTVSAGGTCTEVATFDVPANPNEPDITPVVINTSCDFSNGSINISVLGGTLPYSFLWSNGATSQNLSNLAAGTYNIVVTSANGCSRQIDVVVDNVNPLITLTATIQPNTSCNANATGGVNLSVAPAGNYTYTWSNGATTQDLVNVPDNDYSVTVSAGGSCTEVASFNVPFEPNRPNLTSTVVAANCGLPNGSINLSVFGGVPPYTYLWSSGQTIQDLTQITGGFYVVTVTGANGCTAEEFVDVPDNDIPVSVDGVVNGKTSCIVNNGSINLIISPTNASILWSTGSTALNLTALSPGDYSVTVSAGGTCTTSATFTIDDISELPFITGEILPAVCSFNNGSVDLTVDLGIPPYTYDWGHIPGTANPQDLSNLPTGNYAVTVTTSVGCSEVFFAAIDNDVLPIEITGIVFDDYSCTSNNGFIDIGVEPMVNYTYNWDHIPGNVNPQNLTNLGAGTYSLTVTYGTCTASTYFEVLDLAVPPILSISPVAATCGQTNGAVTINASGASAPYNYNWSNIPGNSNPQNLTNVAPGTYTVTVTDDFNCSATASATVVNTVIALNISGTPAANTSCAAPNGALDISVLPLGNTFVYTWSNAATTQDLTGIVPGIYTVTVSAGVGCSSEATFLVDNNTIDPQLDVAVVAAICSQSNGNINLSTSSGSTPYTWAWSNAATTEDLNNIFPGNYTVTVTDANGCTADTTLNVANNATTFSLSGAVSPYDNCASINGAINLTVTPAGPYTFLWSGGETTEDLANLPAGTYTVQVTESGSCIASATYFVLDERTYPTLNQNVAPELCNLADGQVNISIIGGLAPFNYNWTSGQTTEDLNNIGGGVYTVTVTGANQCSETLTANVPENDLSFSLSGTAVPNSSCIVLNGSVDLDINPAAPSGGPGYTYVWSSGLSTQDLSGIPAGSYIVTVSAGGTCTNTIAFVVDDAAGAPSISEGITEALCGQNSGGINLSVNSGAAPYNFIWSNAATTEDLTDILSGPYSVTITGSNGCVVTSSFVVPEDVVIPTLSGIPQPNTACVGPNGSINLGIAPASLTYTILWSTGETTQNLNNLTSGTYTVVVNGGGACTASDTYTVGNNTIAVTAGGTDLDVLCFNENTGAINLILNGGTQPFDFSWNPGSLGNIEDPSGLPAGNYAVTVTDAVGCTTTATFNVSQPASAVQVSCSTLNSVSQPGFTDGSAQVQIGGGVAPYTVLWSPGGSQNGVATGNFPLNNLGVGNYDVSVTDANGCTSICNFAIPLATCETVVGDMGDAQLSLCGNDCITANYNALGQVLDANDVLQFILHEGSGALIVDEIARSSQPSFCFNQATMDYGTTYYVSAVAGNNDGTGNVNLAHFCTVIATGTPIVFYEKPVASAAAAEPITCKTLIVGIAGNSSLPNATFLWSTQNGSIVGNNNQANIEANDAGNYTLIIQANGCADTTAAEVLDIRNDPAAKIEASPDDILDCVIDEIILAGEVKGSGNANSIWYDQNGVTYPGGTVLQIVQPGTYWFAIVDTLTFCTDTASIVIGENQIYPPLFINPPATLTCAIGSVTLSGGSPISGILFEWATVIGQDTTIVGTGSSVSVSQPNTYILLAVDPVNGCNNAQSITVVADQSFPTADAGPAFSIDCYGQTAPLNGSAIGGTGVLTYNWTTSGGLIMSGSNTLSPTISEPGTYTLLVTSTGNGCSDTDAVVIAPNEPEAIATVDNPACFGERGSILIDTVLGAKPPIQYTLTGGAYIQSGSLFSNLEPGDYTILVEDANGCKTTTDATVIQPDEFQVSVDPQVAVQLGESYLVNATINVPLSEVDQIIWTPSTWLSCDTCLSTRIDTPLHSQTYRILVITKEGCRDDAPLLLRVNREVNVYIPNIFTPNEDGENDGFTVYADLRGVKQVKLFQIYSRWGEQVFVRENFQPNDPTLGWDGRFRGQDMNPAVFVYYAIVEFIDGQEVLFKGDVTVKR